MLACLELLGRGNVDLAKVGFRRVGVLTDALKIGWLAVDRGRLVVDHSYGTDINHAAALHLLACLPQTQVLEFCVEPGPLRTQLIRNPLQAVDGYVAVPEEPGLGIELDESIVERHAVPV